MNFWNFFEHLHYMKNTIKYRKFLEMWKEKLTVVQPLWRGMNNVNWPGFTSNTKRVFAAET